MGDFKVPVGMTKCPIEYFDRVKLVYITTMLRNIRHLYMCHGSLPGNIHPINLEFDLSIMELVRYIRSLLYDDDFCGDYWNDKYLSEDRKQWRDYWYRMTGDCLSEWREQMFPVDET
ncbi:MAG: hypothetical protein WCT26_03450 [Candidatus Buchananbacteria bacterium]